MSGWLPKAGTVRILRLAATIAKYSRVTLENTRFSLISERPPSSSSFVIFLSSLLCLQPRYTRSFPSFPADATSKFYTRETRLLSTPDFDSQNFASSRSFVRSRPFASPLPFPMFLEPLESLLRLFTNYRTHFHPSIVFRSRSESRSSISGENQLLPVCFVVNGSPRGTRSARHSRNKEILSSGLYSILCLSSQGNHYRYYFSDFLTFCNSQCV